MFTCYSDDTNANEVIPLFNVYMQGLLNLKLSDIPQCQIYLHKIHYFIIMYCSVTDKVL